MAQISTYVVIRNYLFVCLTCFCPRQSLLVVSRSDCLLQSRPIKHFNHQKTENIFYAEKGLGA